MTKNLTFLLVISLLTCSIEVDISVPSFPDISDHFNISDGLTQMTIALNFLGLCIAGIAYGPLSDAFGRRKIMIIGNAIMLVGATGCALANSIELLLFSRFIQGIGASASLVVGFAMVADSYSAQESSKIIGIMNALITVFMSIAPIAGGFINESIGWRGNYTVIAIISIISWLMLYLWLPETKERLHPLQTKKIIADFKILLLDRRFILASLVPSLFGTSWMVYISSSSFLYMETYDLPILYYAMHQGAIISAFSGVSFYSGKITKMIGEKNCIVYGSSLHLLSCSLLVAIATFFEKAPYLTSMSMIIGSIGAAISYPVIFGKSLQIFPDIKGTSSSTIMSMRTLICAIFIAISSYFYSGKLISVATILLIISTLITALSMKMLQVLPFSIKEKK